MSETDSKEETSMRAEIDGLKAVVYSHQGHIKDLNKEIKTAKWVERTLAVFVLSGALYDYVKDFLRAPM